MLLIDEHIIANKNIINSKEDITDVRVLIEKPSREKQEHYNLTAGGILLLTLKNNPAYKTQAELNTFLDLDENNPVYVNGYLLEHDTYTIATESIVEVELVAPNNENNLTEKVINVWTLTQEERENGCALSQIK